MLRDKLNFEKIWLIFERVFFGILDSRIRFGDFGFESSSRDFEHLISGFGYRDFEVKDFEIQGLRDSKFRVFLVFELLFSRSRFRVQVFEILTVFEFPRVFEFLVVFSSTKAVFEFPCVLEFTVLFSRF